MLLTLSTVINFEDKITIFPHFLKDAYVDTIGNDLSWVTPSRDCMLVKVNRGLVSEAIKCNGFKYPFSNTAFHCM